MSGFWESTWKADRPLSPDTRRAASEARKVVAPAMSSDCASRFNARVRRVKSPPALILVKFDMSVSTKVVVLTALGVAEARLLNFAVVREEA